VHQALVNVITNGVQAMGSSPGRLTVSVASDPAPPWRGADETPRPCVCVAVTDTGPGIPEAVLPRIFDAFFTTKPVGQGTGIGLAVVHRLMQGMGGDVRAESPPGHGATFRLWFPAVTAARRDDPTPAPAGGPTTTVAVGHVLLVDDESAVAAACSRVLQRLGWQVSVCAGEEAASEALAFDVHSVDAAVIDLAMPELDGVSVLTALRAVRPGLPAVIASGDLGAADPSRLATVQPVELLEKPYTSRALSAALAAALASAKRAG